MYGPDRTDDSLSRNFNKVQASVLSSVSVYKQGIAQSPNSVTCRTVAWLQMSFQIATVFLLNLQLQQGEPIALSAKK